MRYVATSLSLLLVVAVATPSLAAQRNVLAGGIRGGTTGTVVVGPTITGGGTGTTQLTSGDCWAVGGTIVTPGDDRCGVGGKYCRLPDTNAICIQEKLQ